MIGAEIIDRSQSKTINWFIVRGLGVAYVNLMRDVNPSLNRRLEIAFARPSCVDWIIRSKCGCAAPACCMFILVVACLSGDAWSASNDNDIDTSHPESDCVAR